MYDPLKTHLDYSSACDRGWCCGRPDAWLRRLQGHLLLVDQTGRLIGNQIIHS